MNVQELRIGNYVYDDFNDIHRVESIQSQKCIDFNGVNAPETILSKIDGLKGLYQSEYINPIPLNEDILLMCGFENEHDEIDGVYYDIYYIPKTDYVVEYKLKEKVFVFCFDENSGIGVELKHLHQLQNLHFALIGKELEVKI